jgi:hypothetical protein
MAAQSQLLAVNGIKFLAIYQLPVALATRTNEKISPGLFVNLSREINFIPGMA